MVDLSNIDVSNAEDQREGFRDVPPGEYLVEIENTEMKATKAGTGHYLDCQLGVVEGEYQNSKIWKKINTDNPNPLAEAIGIGELVAMSGAAGFDSVPTNSEMLHGKVIMVVVKLGKEYMGERKPEVKAFYPKEKYKPKTTVTAGDRAPWAHQANEKPARDNDDDIPF